MYDMVIIGAGPAGLTACLYALRSRLHVLVVDHMQLGGYLGYIDNLENYPGFPEGISGMDLTQNITKQLEHYDFKFEQKKISAVVSFEKTFWKLETDSKPITARTVVIATGCRPRALGVPGEQELLGKGVSYCAICDARFFKNQDIVVIGGGNTALEEAVYLTRFGRSVTVVHRRDAFRADPILQERAQANEKISFALSSVCTEILGKQKVEAVRVKDAKGNGKDIPAQGVFVFAGTQPETGFLSDLLKKDEAGYLITDENRKTSQEGIFACGDCCKTPLRQVVTACADGAVAAYAVRKYLQDNNWIT